MTTMDGWSRERIQAFLAEEQLGYQRIALPYGLATPGSDRTATADEIFPAQLDGRSVLDVGCSLGFFCHEASRRRAGRVLGLDVDENRVRQARLIADCLQLPIEFQVHNIERLAPVGVFDLVLCLNVLHKVRDPLAVLDVLIECTREKLILELPGPQDPRARAGPDGVPAAHDADTCDATVLIGGGRLGRGDDLFFFTPGAVERLLLDHRRTIARVNFLSSPLDGRFLVVAWKRQIENLVIVAGLPGSGRSRLSKRLLRGTIPALHAVMGMEMTPSWVRSSPSWLLAQPEPLTPGMLFEYSLLRGSSLGAGSFEADPSLDVLACPSRTRVLMVWRDLPALLARLEARRAARAPDTARERNDEDELRDNPRIACALFRKWFDFCRSRGLQVEYVDLTGEPELIGAERFSAKLRSAGWEALST